MVRDSLRYKNRGPFVVTRLCDFDCLGSYFSQNHATLYNEKFRKFSTYDVQCTSYVLKASWNQVGSKVPVKDV